MLSHEYKMFVKRVQDYAEDIEMYISDTETRRRLCVLSSMINNWIRRERRNIGFEALGEEDAIVQECEARDTEVQAEHRD